MDEWTDYEENPSVSEMDGRRKENEKLTLRESSRSCLNALYVSGSLKRCLSSSVKTSRGSCISLFLEICVR